MTSDTSTFDRKAVEKTLGWYARGFGYKSVIATGVIASSGFWARSTPGIEEYVAFVCAGLTGILFLVAFGVMTRLVDVALCADLQVAEKTFNHARTISKWRGVMMISKFQTFLVCAALGSALAAFVLGME